MKFLDRHAGAGVFFEADILRRGDAIEYTIYECVFILIIIISLMKYVCVNK